MSVAVIDRITRRPRKQCKNFNFCRQYVEDEKEKFCKDCLSCEECFKKEEDENE